jgi:hypothetical protein
MDAYVPRNYGAKRLHNFARRDAGRCERWPGWGVDEDPTIGPVEPNGWTVGEGLSNHGRQHEIA